MSPFTLRAISFAKVELRPLKGRPYEYRFYVDLPGVPSELNCANAPSHSVETREFLVVLGSYKSVAVPS